jgi:hypothetical protein
MPYQILGKQDIPPAEYPFLTAPDLNFSFSVNRDNVFPADNIVPRIFPFRWDLPEEDRFCGLRYREESKPPPGLKWYFDLLEMGLVICAGIEPRHFHGHVPCSDLRSKKGKMNAFS